MSARVKVRKERHFKPHAEFYHAASVHLKHVQDRLPGNYYSLISSVMMTAFAFEAYMNYLGPRVAVGWGDFESSSTLAKYRHIAQILSLDQDWSRRPLQSLKDIFSFRNRMAHPRDEKIVEEYEDSVDHYEKRFYSMASPKWLADVTEKKARQFYEDVGKIMDGLNSRLPVPEALPTMIDGGSGHASVIDQNKN